MCYRVVLQAGDPFEVSDADTMLKYINEKAAIPASVVMFTKEGCSFCTKAKAVSKTHDNAIVA